MKIVDKILLAFCGVLALGLMFYIMVVFDAKDMHSVIASTLETVGQIVHSVLIGAVILFVAGVCMGIIYALVHIHREHSLVRPNKHGAVQAIRYGKQTILLDMPVHPQQRMEEFVALMASMQKALPYMANVVDSKAPGHDMSFLPQGSIIPKAPIFSDMAQLITSDKLVLCYTSQGPVYGTVLDLLSMCVVGKPGRGKSTALLYYILILLMSQAEVWVWDPHSGLNELAYGLNYCDDLADIEQTVPTLHKELDERRKLWKTKKQTKHPLLLLVDEMPVIADFENARIKEIAKMAKAKRKSKDAEDDDEDMQLVYEQQYKPSKLLKRFVLEARKWNCYVILSGQALPAEVLSTLTRDNMSSRIVFESSNMHARMAGLQKEEIDRLLPQLRGAGSGIAVMDVSRWSKPEIAAIPYTTVDDLRNYIDHRDEKNDDEDGWDLDTEPFENIYRHKAQGTYAETAFYAQDTQKMTVTGDLVKKPVEQPVKRVPDSPEGDEIENVTPLELGANDSRFSLEQEKDFLKLYTAYGNVKECLRRMRNSKGEYGVSNRYNKHASWLADFHDLRK